MLNKKSIIKFLILSVFFIIIPVINDIHFVFGFVWFFFPAPIYYLTVVILLRYYEIIKRKFLLVMLLFVNVFYIVEFNSFQGLKSIIAITKNPVPNEDFPIVVLKIIISSVVVLIGFAFVPQKNQDGEYHLCDY